MVRISPKSQNMTAITVAGAFGARSTPQSATAHSLWFPLPGNATHSHQSFFAVSCTMLTFELRPTARQGRSACSEGLAAYAVQPSVNSRSDCAVRGGNLSRRHRNNSDLRTPCSTWHARRMSYGDAQDHAEALTRWAPTKPPLLGQNLKPQSVQCSSPLIRPRRFEPSR